MLKQIIITTIICLFPIYVNCAEPSTQCPSGYRTVKNDYITISDTGCPTGYNSIQSAYSDDSCLSDTHGNLCLMYAPANTEYTDTSGTYEFISICPLE